MEHGHDHWVDPLTRASIRFGSDKFGGHQYTPEYHNLLGHFRERKVNVLEIGVGGYASPESGGSSLRMWAEYFPYARIVGLDIAPKTFSISSRVSIVQGSQIDEPLLERLSNEFGPFHVIIDDGSHVPEHMVATFRHLYPRLTADGIYIVEDTQSCFGPRTRANLDFTIFGLAYSISLHMHRQEGYSSDSSDPDVIGFADITKSVSFSRNFISLSRGNNNYPSNLQLDLSNEFVSSIYRTIERESINNPSERSVLCRIDMCIWGREYEKADELAAEAMSLYPDSLSLLYELLRMMEWANRPLRISALQARIAELA